MTPVPALRIPPWPLPHPPTWAAAADLTGTSRCRGSKQDTCRGTVGKGRDNSRMGGPADPLPVGPVLRPAPPRALPKALQQTEPPPAPTHTRPRPGGSALAPNPTSSLLGPNTLQVPTFTSDQDFDLSGPDPGPVPLCSDFPEQYQQAHRSHRTAHEDTRAGSCAPNPRNFPFSRSRVGPENVHSQQAPRRGCAAVWDHALRTTSLDVSGLQSAQHTPSGRLRPAEGSAHRHGSHSGKCGFRPLRRSDKGRATGWCSHGGLPAGGKGLTDNLSYSLIITQTSTKPSSAGTRKHSQPRLLRPRLPSLWDETFTAHLHTHAGTYAQRGSTPGIRAPCWCRLCSSLDDGPGGLSLSTEKAKKSHCLPSRSSCRMTHTVCNTSGINPPTFHDNPWCQFSSAEEQAGAHSVAANVARSG